MTHTLFLKIALPVIALPALVVLFLPTRVMLTYVDVVEPISLLAGSFLALWVSFSYRKELKATFIFLSVFLLIYSLAIVLLLGFSPLLLPYLEPHFGVAETFHLIQSVQFINYAMLFLFCINLLKVIDVKKLNRKGWAIFGIAIIFCYFLAIYPVLDLIKNFSSLTVPEFSHIAMRILDASLIIVLVPVLWLYIQYLKSQQRQSLTFTVIIFGIVCATLFDYLLQLVTIIFPGLIAKDSLLYIPVRELLFIYGYSIIAVGLYAHRKEDEWGYNTVDKVMNGELKLVDAK
ncbi:MAG: hypothetical protein V1932_05980 [Chloroflexota bacterium]